jgi:hypothetical protein
VPSPPDNVMVVNWFPQHDLLGNTKVNPGGEQDRSSLLFIRARYYNCRVHFSLHQLIHTQSHFYGCLDWQPRQFINTVEQRRRPLPRYEERLREMC